MTKDQKIGVILALILGIFLSFSVAINFRTKALAEKHTKLNETLTTTITKMEEHSEHLQRIYNLSVEFGFDPLIVELVADEAEKIMQPTEPTTISEEWRLIQTPKYLTYLMLSLIAVESNGNTWAVGDKGKARGLTQIWTTTAKIYQEDITAEALLNPQVNIDISFQHFHSLLKKYYGNFTLVLYAWNRGSGKVDRLIAYGRSVENGYGRKVYTAALTQNGGIFND